MLVKVRKVGALGIFYWVEFPDMSKDEWFKRYSDEWEFYCFSGLIK